MKSMSRPLLIAEVGGNHEGNFDYAKTLCMLAAESSADVVKLQLYRAESLVNPLYSPDRFQHFKKFELSRDQYEYLASQIVDSGKSFMASVWDIEMLDWIDDYTEIYKIGSGDLTAFKIIKEFATRGKPIILSTGLSNFDEISRTIDYIYNVNSKYREYGMLTLLQCTSMYPIPLSAANLAVLNSFRTLFNVPVGYSDHTEGSLALEIASIMGASVLEFHFTDSREGKQFRDHKVSLTPGEVNLLSERINTFSEIIGSSFKEPHEIELQTGHLTSFRRALYPVSKLQTGHVIQESDLVELRPVHGLPSSQLESLIGKELRHDIDTLNAFYDSAFK